MALHALVLSRSIQIRRFGIAESRSVYPRRGQMKRARREHRRDNVNARIEQKRREHQVTIEAYIFALTGEWPGCESCKDQELPCPEHQVAYDLTGKPVTAEDRRT